MESSPSAAIAERPVDRYPCPKCGADTTLEPGTDALACAHCGHKGTIAEGGAPFHEHDLTAAMAGARQRPFRDLTDGGREVQCKNCGARIVTDHHAQRCAFCDSALVVELADGQDGFVPESVLPFAIDKAGGAGRFSTWLKKRWFAPSDLVARAQRDALDGVYLPFWTYDSETTTRYVGQRGDHYYVTEHYTDAQGTRRSRQVRKTRWRGASGQVEVSFDDVLVCASKSLPAPLVTRLEPWDLHELRPFDGKYLAGFVAERYQVGLEEGFRLAEARMEPEIERVVRADIGGDEQRIFSMQVRHRDTTFKHVLLPVWMSSFRYGEKVYRVTVNARTGEVSGERPWSWIKITALVLVVVAAIAAAVYFTQVARGGEQQGALPPAASEGLLAGSSSYSSTGLTSPS